MRKIDGFIQKLKLIIDDSEKLEKFVIENSNLPGPRANLELAFALSEVYENFEVLENWARIDVNQANVNDPKSFLPFCSAVCLGKLYAKTKNEKIVHVLKKMANDDRWRIREAVAFGFQKIGEDNLPELKKIFLNGSINPTIVKRDQFLLHSLIQRFLTETLHSIVLKFWKRSLKT